MYDQSDGWIDGIIDTIASGAKSVGRHAQQLRVTSRHTAGSAREEIPGVGRARQQIEVVHYALVTPLSPDHLPESPGGFTLRNRLVCQL